VRGTDGDRDHVAPRGAPPQQGGHAAAPKRAAVPARQCSHESQTDVIGRSEAGTGLERGLPAAPDHHEGASRIGLPPAPRLLGTIKPAADQPVRRAVEARQRVEVLEVHANAVSHRIGAG
jgi:hypothetical protein